MHDNTIVHPASTLSPSRVWTHLSRIRVLGFVISAMLLMLSIGVAAAGADVPTRQLIVAFDEPTSSAEARALAEEHGGTLQELLPGGMAVIEVGAGEPRGEVADALADDDGVRFATPNHIVSASSVAGDPLLASGDLWGTLRVRAPEAWGVTRGGGTVVAVLDGGVNLSNPEIAPSLWTNPGEIAANGIDDDNDGFVDNVHGADWLDRDGNPQDPSGHGTHVAGTIAGAAGNGFGGAGVAPDAKVMPLRFLDSRGNGTLADAIQAIDFAIRQKVDVINASWGGPDFSPALRDALARAGAAGITVVAAAGNDGRSNDTRPTYPAALKLPNLISVAASDQNDELARFSNFGRSVSLAAPGVGILSSSQSGIAAMSGTSMAAPHVAGIAALVRSWRVGLAPAEVVASVKAGARPSAALGGKVASGGVADAAGALAVLGAPTSGAADRGSAPRAFRLKKPGKRVRIRGKRGWVRFAWSRATDRDRDLVGYNVIVGGKLRAHVRSTHARIKVPAGRIAWKVVALDAQGNTREATRSPLSNGRITVLGRPAR